MSAETAPQRRNVVARFTYVLMWGAFTVALALLVALVVVIVMHTQPGESRLDRAYVGIVSDLVKWCLAFAALGGFTHYGRWLWDHSL